MAQVMVNFRIDEDVKKNMEQACREMGLNMTTAFTIFATKVGREKRIPFEITAEPHSSGPLQRRRRGIGPRPRGEAAVPCPQARAAGAAVLRDSAVADRPSRRNSFIDHRALHGANPAAVQR